MNKLKSKLKLFALTGSALMMLTSCTKEMDKNTDVTEVVEEDTRTDLEKALDEFNLNYPYLVFDTMNLYNLSSNAKDNEQYRIIRLENKDGKIECKDEYHSGANVKLLLDETGELNISYTYNDTELYYGSKNTLMSLNDFLKQNNLGYLVSDDYSYDGVHLFTDVYYDEKVKDALIGYRKIYDASEVFVFHSDELEKEYYFFVDDTKPHCADFMKSYDDIKDNRNQIFLSKRLDDVKGYILTYGITENGKQYVDVQDKEDPNFDCIKPLNEFLEEQGCTVSDEYRYYDIVSMDSKFNSSKFIK